MKLSFLDISEKFICNTERNQRCLNVFNTDFTLLRELQSAFWKKFYWISHKSEKKHLKKSNSGKYTSTTLYFTKIDSFQDVFNLNFAKSKTHLRQQLKPISVVDTTMIYVLKGFFLRSKSMCKYQKQIV